MTLKQYLTLMILSTVLCWAAWIFVLVNVDPTQTSAIGFLFFYISFLLAIIGSASLLLFGIYKRVSRGELPMFRLVQKSFRDASAIAVVISALLYLQGRGIIHVSALILFLLPVLCLLGCVVAALRSRGSLTSV